MARNRRRMLEGFEVALAALEEIGNLGSPDRAAEEKTLDPVTPEHRNGLPVDEVPAQIRTG